MINYHSDSLINDIKEINKIAQQNKNKIEIHSSWNSNNLTIYIGHRTIWIFYKPSSRFQEKSDYKITSFRSKCFGSVEGRSFPEELKTYMELWYKIQNNTITDIDTILNMVAIGDSLRNLKALHDIWFEVVYEKALLHQIGRGYKLSLLLNHTHNHNRLRTKEQAFEFLYKIIHKEEQISKAFYSELDFEVKEKIKKYDAFASMELEEVYSPEKLQNALYYKANTFASLYIENLGKGKFKTSPLPYSAQLSNINDMLVKDINNDGNLDILAVQNLYVSEIETPRNDAGIGIFLLGNGKGGFKNISSGESGFFASGDAKKIKLIDAGSQELVLIAQNNDSLQSFQLKK